MNTLDTATTREITRQVAGLTATELGEAWTVDTSPAFAEHRAVYLDGPDGQRLALSLDWKNADRVEVSGVYAVPAGHSLPYGTASHRIGVGRDRGPRVMAREITRRLLPGYVEELAKVREHVGQADERHGSQVATADAIGEAVGKASVDHGSPSDGSSRVRWFIDGPAGYGDARVQGSTVSMDLRSLSPELAVKIAQVIAAARP